MPDPSDSLPSESLADGLETQKPSRLLWWLHPKVALPLLFFGLLLAAPFLLRAYRISRISDIGDPFDINAFGTVEIAPDDNAMTRYARAATFLVKGLRYSTDEKAVFEHGWTETSEFLRKWLDDNQPALTEWRKGTEQSQAVAIQPKDWRIDSTLDSTLRVIEEEARTFTQLARLQAERCAHDGDLEAAWGWLVAAVRASRHVGQNGCLVQRLYGIGMFSDAADGIKRWSAHPQVTAELLRKALAEFREADGLTPENSVAMKTQYLMLRNTLKDPKTLKDGLGDGITVPPMLFVMGEPDLSLKVFQHVFANILSEIDKPNRDRAPSAGGSFHLYDLPPGSAACMPARELDNVIKSSVVAGLVLPSFEQANMAMQREAVRRVAVPVLLACQLHFRLHGDWPAKAEDLVPDILAEPPADPLGKSGELMRLKRDGDDLVIYSVGLNGVDDGGNIDAVVAFDPNEVPDLGIRAKRPTNAPNPTPSETTPPEKN